MDFTQIAITFLAALPATIAAVSALIASLRNSHKIDDNTKITQAASAKTVKEVDIAIKKSAEDAKTTDRLTAVKVVAAAKQVALETALPAALAAQEAKQVAAETKAENKEAIQNLATAVNGRLTEMLQANHEKAFADGVLEGERRAKAATQERNQGGQ